MPALPLIRQVACAGFLTLTGFSGLVWGFPMGEALRISLMFRR